MGQLENDLRDWAAHIYATEAGVELLIRAGRFIYDGAPWIAYDEGSHTTYIDTIRLIGEVGVLSGGEQSIARIGASLLGGTPVDLATELPGLDRDSTTLVLAAVAHAAGSHEGSDVTFDSAGRPTFGPVESLHPWPATQSAGE